MTTNQGGAGNGGAGGGASGGRTATGGVSANQGGSSLGSGGSAGGAIKDAGALDAPLGTSDALSADATSDHASSDVPSDGSADGVRACRGIVPGTTYNRCHTSDDCRSGPQVCLAPGQTWGPGACPIPPNFMCHAIPACTSDKDCTDSPGGTCVGYVVQVCPRCDSMKCQYPPPPPPLCTKSPDSCGTGNRCRTDGACEPLPCSEGYSCASGSRCSVGSARADGHGCELIPCNSGFTCDENTRCTAPTDPGSHGCTTIECNTDGDCDCGFCVWGSCYSTLGTCSTPPS